MGWQLFNSLSSEPLTREAYAAGVPGQGCEASQRVLDNRIGTHREFQAQDDPHAVLNAAGQPSRSIHHCLFLSNAGKL